MVVYPEEEATDDVYVASSLNINHLKPNLFSASTEFNILCLWNFDESQWIRGVNSAMCLCQINCPINTNVMSIGATHLTMKAIRPNV